MPLSEVGRSVSYGEAIYLVSELQKDQGSRLFASMAGWSYPMSRSEFYAGALLQTVKNALRGEKDEPLVLVWPWPDSETNADITAEERAEFKAQLRSSSAFAQVRSPEAAPSTNE